MPTEGGQNLGGSQEQTVMEFRKFTLVLEELHNSGSHQSIMDGLRVSKKGIISRVFSEAEQEVLAKGTAENTATSTAIAASGSAPITSLAIGAEDAQEQLPSRSSRRGKLKVRDSNASLTQQEQQEAAAADRGKRQRTAVVRVGEKGEDNGSDSTVAPAPLADVPGPEKDGFPQSKGSVGDEPEPGDKENGSVPKARGRPPLPRRKKGGASGSSIAADAGAAASNVENLKPPSTKTESIRRSGRNSSSNNNKNSTSTSTSTSRVKDFAEKLAELRAIDVLPMKVVDLRAELKKLGASATGLRLKADLQERLRETISARVAELEDSLPQAAAEGDKEGEKENVELEELEKCPSPAAVAAAHENTVNIAPDDSRERPARSSVATGAALGSLTRLSMPRLSTESTAVETSPVRSSPSFGDEPEEKDPAVSKMGTAGAAAAAGDDDDDDGGDADDADPDPGAETAAEAATANVLPQDGNDGDDLPDGDGGGEDKNELDMRSTNGLEGDNDDADSEVEVNGTEKDEVAEEASAGKAAEMAAASGAEKASGAIAVPGDEESSENKGERGKEQAGDNDEQSPISPLPRGGAAMSAVTPGGDGGVVPISDNVAEVVPHVVQTGTPGDMMELEEEDEHRNLQQQQQQQQQQEEEGDEGGEEEEEEEEDEDDEEGGGEEEGEISQECRSRVHEVVNEEHELPSEEESGRPGGASPAREESKEAGSRQATAVDVSADKAGAAAVEKKTERADPRVEDDAMDVEDSGNEEDPEGISPPGDVASRDVSVAQDSGGHGSGYSNRYPCKTPSSNGAASRSSTALLSSCGSLTTTTAKMDQGVENLEGSSSGGGGGAVGVGEKRARPAPTPGASGGGGGGGGGGGKRTKAGKEKVSLQEIMSKMRKDYAQKGGTPGAASKRANPGSRKVPAEILLAAKPAAAPPAPSSSTTTSTTISTSATLPPTQAQATGAPAPAVEVAASVRPAAMTSSPEPAAVSAVSKPPNLITTLNSFTSVLSKNNAPAPLGKWDRLATGASASFNPRSVPALRKAEEARLHEERRQRERAASRLKVQASSTTGVFATGQPAHGTSISSSSTTRKLTERPAAHGEMTREAVEKTAPAAATLAGSATGLKSAAGHGVEGGSSGRGGGPPPPSHLAPLRVTGMLSKLVPSTASADPGAVAMTSAAVPYKRKISDASSVDPSEPLSRPTGNTLAGGAAVAASAVDGDTASVRSVGSTSSSSFSIGVTAALGGGSSSTVSSSERVEMKIRDQRAKIALKRNARMEKLKAEEERRKAELETKELRDAARLEASRRVKLEADARIREQKAQRQAEVEQRREHERAEKEARDAKERREREARRLAAIAEAKARPKPKPPLEGATEKALTVKKPEPVLTTATTGAATAGAASTTSTKGNGATVMPTTAVEGKPVAVLKRVSPSAVAAPGAPGSVSGSGGDGGRPAAPVVSSTTPSVTKPFSSTSMPTASAAGTMAPAPGAAAAGGGASGAAAAAGAGVGTGVVESYEMSDHDGDTSESESDEEEEEKRERRRRAGKKVPSWARGKALSEALHRQYANGPQIDPDKIFPTVYTCDLEAIFSVNKSRYHRRGSSAHWSPHRVTPQEILTYKRSVGITKPNK